MESARQIIGAEELAGMLNMPVSTLKKDAQRKPEKLPPRVKLPGSPRLAWKLSTVEAWMDALKETREADHA